MDSLVLQMYAQLHNPWWCRVSLAVTQNVLSATDTLVLFDTVADDPNGNFSVGTHLYTAPVAGRYLVAHRVALSSWSGTGQIIAGWYYNANSGTPQFFGSGIYNALAGSNFGASRVGIAKLNAGDTLGGHVWQSSGATQPLGITNNETSLEISWLGPL